MQAFWIGFEKVAKLRGRSLRKLRTFLAKNKSYGGHATNQFGLSDILTEGKILSAKDHYKMKGVVPPAGEKRNLYSKAKSADDMIGHISMYPDGMPFVREHLKNRPPERIGFGRHGVLVPAEPHHAGVAKSAPNIREIRSTKPVDVGNGLFVAPKETINTFRQMYKDKTFLTREDLKKSYPDLFQEYKFMGSLKGAI